MKKKYILLPAAVLFVVFLLCQFLLHRHTAVISVSMITYVELRYYYHCV